MQTTINQTSPVEHELLIEATAEDLADEIKSALKAQQARTQMKGFRPGKVPMSLVRKMYGKALAYGVAEQKVQATYEAEVVENDDYDVLGRPMITELEYELDGELRAVVQFGVRPTVELADLSNEQVLRLVNEVTDEDIDKEVEGFRRRQADLTPIEGEGAGEEDHVLIDLQQLDEESGAPLVGKKEEDTAFFLDDENVQDELKQALLGKKPGDTARVTLPHGEGDHAHTHSYEVTLKELKRRELPELDDAFVGEATDDRLDSVDALRAEIRREMESAWEGRSREMLEGQVMERMLELHPVPVPRSVVETFLESFIEDIRQRNENELPEGFDEATFRKRNTAEAERQGRWMLIRDAVVKAEDLEVTEEDLDAHFQEQASQGLPPDFMKQYYQRMGLLDRVRQQLLSHKVYGALIERFDVQDRDLETFNEEMKARYDAQAAKAEAEVPVGTAEGTEEPATEGTEEA